MANYKQVSAFCGHCQRQVLANKPEIDHTFYLIATLFSCGLFAIPWILQMMFSNPPALCSVCGTTISNQTLPSAGGRQMTGQNAGFNRVNTKEATGKGLPPLGNIAIIVAGLFCGLMVLLNIFGSKPKPADQTAVPVAPNSSLPANNLVYPSPSVIPSKSAKQWIDQDLQAGGLIVKEDNGQNRPYAEACQNGVNNLAIFNRREDQPQVPLKLKIITFERCVELRGDLTQAYTEMSSRLEKYQAQINE